MTKEFAEKWLVVETIHVEFPRGHWHRYWGPYPTRQWAEDEALKRRANTDGDFDIEKIENYWS